MINRGEDAFPDGLANPTPRQFRLRKRYDVVFRFVQDEN
jgi:hypothetical protein